MIILRNIFQVIIKLMFFKFFQYLKVIKSNLNEKEKIKKHFHLKKFKNFF